MLPNKEVSFAPALRTSSLGQLWDCAMLIVWNKPTSALHGAHKDGLSFGPVEEEFAI